MTDELPPLPGEQPDDEAPVVEVGDAEERKDRSIRTLNIVRGYVLLFVGCGLIVWAFIGTVKPGALTLGGALIGFNPLLRAGMGGGPHGG